MSNNILYRLTFPNGKVYIGITTEPLKRRVRRHVLYARQNKAYALSAAIRKYGEDSFLVEHLALAMCWEDLLLLERQVISQYNSVCPSGYNMTGGGEGSFGIKPSDGKRKRISESLTGRVLSLDHRIAVGLAQKGKTIPPSTRKKMSDAHKSRPPMSEEQKSIRREAANRQHAARRIENHD